MLIVNCLVGIVFGVAAVALWGLYVTGLELALEVFFFYPMAAFLVVVIEVSCGSTFVRAEHGGILTIAQYATFAICWVWQGGDLKQTEVLVAFSVSGFVMPLIGRLLTRMIWRKNRLPNIIECRKCKYDLRGNESGYCPECGTPIHGAREP
ncbi:MAG: hypothetical protein J5J06_05095 [Phycisphaerae bacterium]|nr:hypothetical protein [Phycisphaerae bacterium]